MAALALLALALAGPLTVAGFAVASGCPRLAIVTGLTTAIYIGVESNSPFFSELVYALLALVGLVVALRVGFYIAGQ